MTAHASLAWGTGLVIISGMMSEVISESVALTLGVVAAVVLVVIGTVAAFIAVIGMYRAPDSLKPGWLLAEEHGRPTTQASRFERLVDRCVLAIPFLLLAGVLLSGAALLYGVLLDA